jgi:flagellar biosynthesis protein FlhB
VSDYKPFEPTQSRLESAKRQGDIARSAELANVVAFAAALASAGMVAAQLAAGARSMLLSASQMRIDRAPIAATLFLLLLPATAAACGATAAYALQHGGVRFVAIAVKWQRLSPAENFRRMFSKESVLTATRATIAFACAAAAIVPAFIGILNAAVRANEFLGLAAAAWSGAFHTALAACAVGAAFAAADYGMQYARWRNRLRMSFEEMKRDQKEHDGDPLARGRRRALHRRLSQASLHKVKEASFVVTNPTHIAIAVEYRPPHVPVPRILLRAADDAAGRVRELAAVHRIPTIENIGLARQLYASARAGDFIPRDTYIAVAEIIAALSKSGVVPVA